MRETRSREGRSRRAALKRLLETAPQGHLSAACIHQLLAAQGHAAVHSTVYSDLSALSRAGHVGETRGFKGERRFERRAEAHHHLLCRTCGRLEDAALDALPEGYVRALAAWAETHGWRLLPPRFTLTGRCPDCAQKQFVAKKGGG